MVALEPRFRGKQSVGNSAFSSQLMALWPTKGQRESGDFFCLLASDSSDPSLIPLFMVSQFWSFLSQSKSQPFSNQTEVKQMFVCSDIFQSRIRVTTECLSSVVECCEV